MCKNSNKKLYGDQLFKVWTEKKDLLPIETYFLKKYLTNKSGETIEAGTGGGRIIFEIEKLGFTNLAAFDYVDIMIRFCKKKKEQINSRINFRTADATNLTDFDNNKFDYIIYLQQVLCFIDQALLPRALEEAYRIGKNDSIYLFSFLNWNSKLYNPILSSIVNLIRIIRNEKTNKYKLPWLNINGAFNWKFLNRDQPQNIWFKKKDVIETLEQNGFQIIEIRSRVLSTNRPEHIHIACKKKQ